MKPVILEKFIEGMKCDVYPVTIIKFLLNKRRILNYVSRVSDKNFSVRKPKFTIDYTDCQQCKDKESMGVLCRQHTSIHRILSGDNVLYDIDTYTFFYKNEIFRMVDDKLIIVYCPHPKLITGKLTDSKVRKVNTLTIDDPKLQDTVVGEMKYNNILKFSSSDLLDKFVKTWFNDEFSIVTLPEDRNFSNFCLIPNR